MAKIVTSQGRLIHFIQDRTVFTSLKELDGDDAFLSQKRKEGFTVIKLTSSQLAHLVHSSVDTEEEQPEFEPEVMAS